MKLLSVLTFVFLLQNGIGQVLLDANGAGNTYELITSVLAPNNNPIETPDCSHNGFGNHIDEVFDNDLNINVFRFHIHTTPDDDRCINFDRQRNEIKAYDKSPDNLLGITDEKVEYKWKFKLESGFQASPNFTHLHQLKSVGGSLASMPMYTLTARKGSPDKLELRYAETDTQITLEQTNLAPFLGSWIEVTETIKYGTNGTYEIELKRISDNSILMTYSNNAIVNWRSGADFVRPKWGIYRSLLNAQDLRDELVYFANFSIKELGTNASENLDKSNSQIVFPNPALNVIQIENISLKANLIQLYGLDGKCFLHKSIDSKTEIKLDVSSFPNGTYLLNIKGPAYSQSELVLIFK